MRERKLRLMQHNVDALRRAEALFVVIGVPAQILARHTSEKLSALTVGQVARRNGLPKERVGDYPQPAYPNATSEAMKTAIAEAYEAMRSGNVEIVPDFDRKRGVNFDHLCASCANNQGNRSCALFDQVFVAVTDQMSSQ